MTESATPIRNLAVIGAGISGITAAHLLSSSHRVTLFEKEPRLGGHTRTVHVPSGPDRGLPVDMGFIVHNDATYPLFTRFLNRMGVATAGTDMSFGYWDRATETGYAGTSLNGLFATRSNLFRPGFWAMLREILRFGRLAEAGRSQGTLTGTLGDFLQEHGFGPAVTRQYLIPLVGAIWSASGRDALQFPMAALAGFLHNHGLLDYRNRPGWLYIPGGSHTYVDRFRATFAGRIVTGAGVRSIRRLADRVEIETDTESHTFDGAVLAVHADTALDLLRDPSPMEQRLLSPWSYSKNRTVLHTDTTLMPPKRNHWAAWTVVREPDADENTPVTLHYHMNRLQRLTARRDYLVTLNPTRPIPDESIIDEVVFTHPRYDPAALATQSELADLNGRNRTWYCGAYQFNGFHEDGARSAVRVARDFGVKP
jgi:predicted NAD/FAD-binding protein